MRAARPAKAISRAGAHFASIKRLVGRISALALGIVTLSCKIYVLWRRQPRFVTKRCGKNINDDKVRKIKPTLPS